MDGTRAFPLDGKNDGMLLVDYFACHLAAAMVSTEIDQGEAWTPAEFVAQQAYDHAEALANERRKRMER